MEIALLKYSVRAALFIMVLFSSLEKGKAINCYSCDSISNENCATNFDKIGLTECVNGTIPSLIFPKSEETDFRMKNIVGMNSRNNLLPMTCYKIIAEVSGKQETFRGCIYKSLGAIACEKIKEYKTVEACGTCNENGCNSSSNLSFNLILMIIPLIPSYYLSR